MHQPNQQQTINSMAIEQKTLEAGRPYRIDPFVLNQNGVYIEKENGKTGGINTIKISEPLFIQNTVQNLDTKEVQLKLCYKYKGKYLDIHIGMGQFVPHELIKLSSMGVDVSHENVKSIASYLREQQKLAPHREIYREVGWHTDDTNNMTFRHHQLFPKGDRENPCNDIEEGLYNLEPKGELAIFKELISTEVIGHAPLETMLCIGFSAPIVGFLSRKYDDVDTFLVHLVGDSTKGKTTAALLAVSPFGIPSNKKKGLMKTWNGTSNATINLITGNHGIPLVLDELSMSSAKSITSELYVLTNGQEKSRLNDEMKQRKQGTWATTLISTGEQSIFERTNQNIGLTVRAFEFSHVSWTTSANNADTIRRVIQENYGHAGQSFIQHIFDQGLSIIDEKWLHWQERCVEALPNSPFRTRIAKKYAVILVAGELANEAMGLGLALDDVMAFLVEHETERMQSRDIGGKAFQYITQQVIQYQANFRSERVVQAPFNCWGKMFFHSDCVEVAFLKHVLQQQLRLGGFDDPKIVLRDWKEKGLLITEGDRITKRTKIFEASEQDERKKVHGNQTVPKKLQDTTYNIKLPLETIDGLIQSQSVSQVAEPIIRFTSKSAKD